MYFRFIFLLTILLTFSTAAIVNPIKQDCVLEHHKHQVCHPSLPVRKLLANITSRMSGRRSKPPCTRRDVVCWCTKSLEYTNKVRQKKGMNMLKLGPKRQMRNAMKYAKKLSTMGYLKHQNLRRVTREVGCKRWIGGENLAFNYEPDDIARKCVDQWIGSKGHYDNLVRPWFQEMVVGFHFDKDGRVYCVQTFSLYFPRQTFGRRNAPKCEPVGTAAP